MLKIMNMQTDRDNYAPNQFIIYTNEGKWFQSYTSMIAFVPKNNSVIHIGGDYDYSRTTMKYLCKFLRVDSITDVRDRLADGRAIQADLDNIFGKNKQVVNIPISECDLESFSDVVFKGHKFDWNFPDQYGTEIGLVFEQDKGEE